MTPAASRQVYAGGPGAHRASVGVHSPRTEQAYAGWIRRFIVFHRKRHPCEMGAAEIAEFLSSLATVGRVSASTQNQALSALLFLYGEVLGMPVESLAGVVRARTPRRLPVVLTRQEVQRVMTELQGSARLAAQLMYGAGLRLMECVELRVKDVDLGSAEMVSAGGIICTKPPCSVP